MVDQSTDWIAHLGPATDAAHVMSSLRNRLTGVPPSPRDPITPHRRERVSPRLWETVYEASAHWLIPTHVVTDFTRVLAETQRRDLTPSSECRREVPLLAYGSVVNDRIRDLFPKNRGLGQFHRNHDRGHCGCCRCRYRRRGHRIEVRWLSSPRNWASNRRTRPDRSFASAPSGRWHARPTRYWVAVPRALSVAMSHRDS